MFSMTKDKKAQDLAKYERIHVVAPKQATIADMIANPPENSVRMEITPEMAEQMLRFNTRNRPVKAGKVDLYARQMRAGEWRYTREPIIFSDTGRVLDGQHRLMACIEAGVTLAADVAFGAPDEAFAFIDVGAVRTASDIFAINGVKNWTAISGITRIVWHYDCGREAITGGAKITAAELYEEYKKLEYLDLSMPIFHKFHGSRLAQPTLMAALHYICARKNRKQANEFFTVVCDGGGDKTDPAVELHKRLIRNATSVEKITRDGLAGLTLTAWNRSRKGLSGRGLGFDGGKLPAVL